MSERERVRNALPDWLIDTIGPRACDELADIIAAALTLCPACGGDGVLTLRESGSNHAIGVTTCQTCEGRGEAPTPADAAHQPVSEAGAADARLRKIALTIAARLDETEGDATRVWKYDYDELRAAAQALRARPSPGAAVREAWEALLRRADRAALDHPWEWKDWACGECVGWETDRGAAPQLCARHAIRALAPPAAGLRDEGDAR